MKFLLFPLRFLILIICLASFSGAVFSQDIALIPQPVSVTQKHGSFRISEKTSLSGRGIPSNSFVLNYLQQKLARSAGYHLKQKASGKADIQLVLLSEEQKQLGTEGYFLSVGPEQINIRANTEKGLFYGFQTLLQLLPAEVESQELSSTTVWTIPCVEVLDYPKLAWRGLMFDVARHFFSKQELKSFIDQMVKYKYNILHLHLTDNEGWRLEIPKYPKLTSVGAWRPHRVGNFGTFAVPSDTLANDYGGFYTEEDIREIVAYAKDRYVDILPEIDMPGHSLAAIAAYPELASSKEAVHYKVRSGEKIMDWSEGGPLPKAIYDNNLSPAKDEVYAFAEEVVSTVARLFPFEYIHIGGDETSKNFWEQSPDIKTLMQKQHLKDMDDVQAYFVKRLKKIIEKHQKKMIGWDEVLDDELSEEAAIMCWRSPEKAVEATQEGHQVVMSPFMYTYLDLRQGDAALEPPVYKQVRLSKAYQFEPLPEKANAELILGGQANLWTEQIYTFRHAQYMTWPRALAIAECLWSPADVKNWENFVSRTENHFERLNQAKINYSPAIYDPDLLVSPTKQNQFLLTLKPEIEGLSLHYSFDNSFPDEFYPVYTEPIVIPPDATTLRLVSSRNGKIIGRMMTISVEDLKKRK